MKQLSFKYCKMICSAVCVLGMLFFTVQLSDGAGGDVEWTYNTAVVGKQEVRSTAIDSIGNIVLVGYVENSPHDYYLNKVLADGSGLAWPAKTLDFAGGEDQAAAVVVDGDDNIILTGYVHNGINFDIHTVKYNGATGAIIWQHSFNGAGGGDDFATALAIDADDNIYVGGTMLGSAANDNMVIIKYRSYGPEGNGEPLWWTEYNGPDNGHDRLTAIDANTQWVAVTGETQTVASDFDFVVAKFTTDKVFSWAKSYSDTGNGTGLDVALDGGDVIATGYIDDGTDRDHYTIKYPSVDGPAIWVKIRDRGYDDEGRSLWLDSSGNAFVAGTSYTLTTNKDLTVTRYAAADGDDTAPAGWHVDYNTVNGNSDVGVAIVGDNAGDLFVTSITNDAVGGFDDIYTYKFCKERGTLLWPAVHGLSGKHDRPAGVELAPDGMPVIGGWSDTAASSYDFVAVKYNAGALDLPTDLVATTVSTTEISLSWQDNSDNEENFIIERTNGTGEDATYTVAYNTVTFTDDNSGAGLTPDHRYYYRVKAINTANGSSAWSNQATARTTLISYDPPAWQHIFAGPDGGDDEPAAIAVGPDHHPVVTGFSFDAIGGFDQDGGYDYYTLKLDRSDAATVQWSARYNDGDNESDFAKAVAIDSNNRAIVSGYASLYYPGGDGNTNDIYTLGYPADSGTPTWAHQYNGPTGNDDRSAAVATSVDGADNVVVVGYGKNEKAIPDDDIYVIKYSADGTPTIPLWAATPYEGGGVDQPSDVAYDLNGDIFVVGKTYNTTTLNFDYYIAKYHGNDGTLAWGGSPKTYDGDGNSTDYASALAVDTNGDLYVTGYSVGSGGSGDIVTIKFDGATGTIAAGWPKSYDGGGYDTGVAIGIDINNNEIVVAGTTFKGPGNHDVVVLRYASDGTEVWTPKFLDFAGSDESAAAMDIDRSGVTCVVASTDSGGDEDIVSIMFDHEGLTVGANVLDGADSGIDYPVDVAFNAYGEAFVAGVTTNADNNTDYIVYKAISTVAQAPTPVRATQLYTEVNLNWADNSLDETGFEIEFRSGACSDSGTWTPVTTAPADSTSHLASGLSPDSAYCFRVRSANALGEKSRWADVDVLTVAAEAPSFFNATPVSTTDVLLEWDDRTTGESQFNLQWCEGVGCSFPVDPLVNSAVLDPDTESYIYPDACEGQSYRFRINAEKTDRWVTPYVTSSPVTMSTHQAASGLTNDWVSEAWAELKWIDNTSDESEFIVQRCEGATCDFSTYNSTTLISPQGNILHLRMDEASWVSNPDEVVDLSPAGNHGRAYNATTTSGKYGNAGSFNGSNGYVSTPMVVDQYNSATGASFAAWVYPTSTSANNHFVISTDDGGNDWSLLRNGANWYVSNGDTLVNTGVAVTTNTWQHLAVTFDPVDGVDFYKNGSNLYNSAMIDFDTSSAPVHVGRRGSLNQEFFDGRIDEVNVFAQPISAAEVLLLFEHGLARYNDVYVVHDTTYKYRVIANKNSTCGWSQDISNVHQVTTTPPAPTDLLGSASHSSRVNLRWTDNTTTESKFVVERCDTAGCVVFAPLPDLIGPDIYWFNDDSVCPGNDYRYQVKAVNEGVWDSGYSNIVDVSTSGLAEPVVLVVNASEEQVDLQWPANTDDLIGYEVKRCTGDAAFCSSATNYNTVSVEPVLPSGAIMMMPMDEPQWRGTPDEVSDITGNGNYGRAYGGVSTIAGGHMLRGGNFDGSNDYIVTNVDINQSAGFTGATFEAWVYPTTTSGARFVFSTDDGGSNWSLYASGNRWALYNGQSGHIPSPNLYVKLNTWQHIVAVFQPGVGVTLYLNGNEGISTVSSVDDDEGTDTNVTIGRQGAYNQNYFQGRIDEAVVYDRPLSAAEVLARYQRTVHNFSEAGLSSGQEYHYRVNAYKDDCSAEGPYNSVSLTTPAPPAPSNLTVTAVSTTQLLATWTDETTSETDYRIQWCEGLDCIFPADVTVNTASLGVDAESYPDNTVCEGTNYRYRVRSEKDWVSESDYTWVTDWASYNAATLAKAADDNFAATTLSESEISLSWDDNNVDEDAYILEKCTVVNDASSCEDIDDANYNSVTLSLQPSMWFKMDESSWGTPVNSAPGGNNATRYGNAQTITDPERGQVGNLDGNGDFLRVNHYAGINPGSAITVSIWAKSNGATWDSDHSLLSKRNAFILSPVLNTSHMRFYVFLSGDTWRSVYIDPGVDITQWHLYTGVYDGNYIKFYVDGVFKGQALWPGTINADTGPLDIGRDEGYTATNRNLGGRIDDAMIFDQALTDAAILSLYNGTLNVGSDYVDTGLDPNTQYFYRLRAAKSANCGWPVEWTVYNTTTLAPPPPTDLKAQTVNTTQIDLSWTDNSGSESGFTLQRCDGVGCSFVPEPTIGTDSVWLPAGSESYSDIDVYEGESYSYRVRAEKASAVGWPTAWHGSVTATAYSKKDPYDLSALTSSESSAELNWLDSNDDETGFIVERCAGDTCTDFAEIGRTGPFDGEDLVYNGTATGAFSPYVYNNMPYPPGGTVRAIRIYNNGSPYVSQTSLLTLKQNTDYVVTFEAWCDAGSDINLQNDIWPDTLPEFAVTVSEQPQTYKLTFNSSHVDMADNTRTRMRFFHYNPGRYVYITNVKLIAPAEVTYTDVDLGLEAEIDYRYQVKAYKNANGHNNWTSGASNIDMVRTDITPPNGLAAVALNTTEVELNWTDNTNSETNTEIWRSPAGCSDYGSTPINEVGPEMTRYVDYDVTEGTDYCYKVIAKNTGLSADGGGSWSHYAPVVISSFQPNSYYQINVAHNSNMRSDFGDLRFYDETSQRQIPYWIKDFVADISATVWIKSRSHNDIRMYYGNPDATDVGNSVDFRDVYTFEGTTIDTDQWVEVDPNNSIEQNDGLILVDQANSSWNKAMITQKAYNRSLQWEIYADVTVGADATYDRFLIGWLLDQETFTSYNQFVHGLFWNYNYFRTYELGAYQSTSNPYSFNADYEVRVVLTLTGAEYYVRGSEYADWTLITSRTGTTNETMRVAVGQSSHNATIHKITVSPVPYVVSLGSEVANVRTDFGYPWRSGDSNVATVTTDEALAPSNVQANGVSDTEIFLNWTDETDAESRFEIRRCMGEGCTVYSYLDEVSGNVTSYTDTGLQVSTSYSYKVMAHKDAPDAIHPWSSPLSNPAATGKTFPQTTNNLIAEPFTSRSVQLTWTDFASDEDGYAIEVKVWNGRFIETGRVGPNEELYLDKVGIEPGTTYIYRVRPYRGDDMSPYSNEDDATPLLIHGEGVCIP